MKKLYSKTMRIFIVLGMLALSTVSYAQKVSVSGTVTDESGQPAPGVSVIEKGTTNGTATDTQGKYVLNVADANATLVFSFIGYKTQEVGVGGRTAVDLTLQPDVTSLQEVVVTGYTEQRKRDITGAVTVIDADQLNSNRSANLGQKLAGRAAGVTVSTSGQPGEGSNINIRGISSFGSNDPLVVVDGIQIQGDKALNAINPNDIESMQVLKDAAAASIYGARASAGVIVVTTKQGKAGKTKLTYDGYVGTQKAVKGYDDFLIQNPVDYAKWQIAKNPAEAAFYGGDAANPKIPAYFYPVNSNLTQKASYDESAYNFPNNIIMKTNPSGTDFWKETFRSSAAITDHNVNLSGGNENSQFSASVGYFKQEGTMRWTDFDRYSARVNSRFTLGRIKFGESISFARFTQVGQNGGNQNEQNVMTQILKMNSILPVYDIAGNFTGAKTVGFGNGTNPVAFAWRNKDNRQINYQVLGSLFAELKITEWLKARSNFAATFSQGFFPNFQYPKYEIREVNATSSYAETHQNQLSWTWTNMLEANKTFGKHNIKAFVGYESNQKDLRRINAQLINYSNFDPRLRYLNQALGTFNSIKSEEFVNTLLSTFGKLDYDYNDKYLLSFTLRRDGSSNFVQNQYGTFPAISAAWRISSESFMQGMTWLTDLKLRGGWGKMGNQSLPLNNAYNGYNQFGAITPFDASYDITGSNGQANGGLTLTAIGNPRTTWEKNTTTNVGFDASLMNGKLSVVFDIYQRKITDLLYNAPLPGTAGNAPQPFSNVAQMTNKGWDLALGYRGNITSDLSFTADLNLSHYTNVIDQLDGNAQFVFPTGVDKRFGEVNAWKVGSPISGFYGYQLDGIFKSQAEVDALNQAGAAVGRFRFKDLNGDGVINDADKGIIGSPHPKLTMGLNLGLNYKKFDFTMFLFGSFGQQIYNYNKLFSIFGQFNSNVDKRVLTDSWSPSNPNGTLPMIDPNDTYSNTSSSFYVESGSYLRAQNVTLGYTLPAVAKLGLSRLRLYVQAQNLFTITKYSGIDPAISSVNVGTTDPYGVGQNNGWMGFDFGNYPSSRTFLFGVNASF